MGIPSYFSYILKNHKHVLSKFSQDKNKNVHYFFLDSNSIIYDCIRDLEKHKNKQLQKKTDNDSSIIKVKQITYKEIYEAVCKKIETYIQQLSPSVMTYIAFDGVAPMAKLEQQRTRRYKSMI